MEIEEFYEACYEKYIEIQELCRREDGRVDPNAENGKWIELLNSFKGLSGPVNDDTIDSMLSHLHCKSWSMFQDYLDSFPEYYEAFYFVCSAPEEVLI